MEASALDDHHVKEVFELLAHSALEKINKQPPPPPTE